MAATTMEVITRRDRAAFDQGVAALWRQHKSLFTHNRYQPDGEVCEVWAFSKTNLQEWLPWSDVLVLVRDKTKIVGCVLAKWDANDLHIHVICSKVKGLGTMMLAKCTVLASEQGKAFVSLWACEYFLDENKTFSLQDLYTRLGFQATKLMRANDNTCFMKLKVSRAHNLLRLVV